MFLVVSGRGVFALRGGFSIGRRLRRLQVRWRRLEDRLSLYLYANEIFTLSCAPFVLVPNSMLHGDTKYFFMTVTAIFEVELAEVCTAHAI